MIVDAMPMKYQGRLIIKNRIMSTCHESCLTCSSNTFTSCLTCTQSLYALSANTCACLLPWQEQCLGEGKEDAIRHGFNFLTLYLQLFLILLIFLYLMRVRLPISYRIWSALGSLSLLVYNSIMELDYEDQFVLKELFAATNGPYFATYRVNNISTIFILPTVVLAGIIVLLFPFMFIPFQLFTPRSNKQAHHSQYRVENQSHSNHNSEEEEEEEGLGQRFCAYLRSQWGHFFDCLVFLCCRMMFYFIGKTISDYSSNQNILFIVVAGVYGALILANWVLMVRRYHLDTLDQTVYDGPLYLYSMLSPISLIGLPLVTSKLLMIVVYASPIVLLLLILLLNRNMKILTWSKFKFYITELISIGGIITFIFVDSKWQTYLLMGAMILTSLVFMLEMLYVLHFLSVDLSGVKVHPEPEREEVVPKRIHQQGDEGGEGGYF